MELAAFYSAPEPPPPKKTRPGRPVVKTPEKLLQEQKVRNLRALSYQQKLDRFFTTESLAAYMKAYREIRPPEDQEGIQRICVLGDAIFHIGNESKDVFQKIIRPGQSEEDSAFYIAQEQRLMLNLMDICIVLGRMEPSRERFGLDALLFFNKREFTKSEVRDAERVYRVSPKRLFHDTWLLRQALSNQDQFVAAIKIEPCLLQTALGASLLQAHSMLEGEFRFRLAEALENVGKSSTRPSHLPVMRALLLLSAFAPEVLENPEITHEMIAEAMIAAGLPNTAGLSPERFNNIYAEIMLGPTIPELTPN